MTFLRLMQAYPANDCYAPSAYLQDLALMLHAEEDVNLGFLCHKYDITMLCDTLFFNKVVYKILLFFNDLFLVN